MSGDIQYTIQQINSESPLYPLAVDLRHRLFFRDLGLPKQVVLDQKEAASLHYAMSLGETLVAYGRLSETGKLEMQVSQMVVAPNFQRLGHGEKLLKHLVEQAEAKGVKMLHLAARLHAVPLYKKLGFKSVGEEYTSTLTNVVHIKMIREVL
ncbi:GNAT family N-acetyltransferase [Enterovibrio nigricans]|uniref:N-acetyltransferase domain-containing protein n=1 Tax=Enterovibrio nigricans DSM 22720 TaxID=1121868 RepID=A0A1T4VG25_9GAMM|nr:GNAT family N-acetyltransferase [Enterovibrio nigricans]PKF49755.1 N-acetyltransferase [Enterovibrio nigricans]SKA63932.1 hypothetical protein SAMN02745132_03804 [Enterovibrio nigricans DSM 22720]